MSDLGYLYHCSYNIDSVILKCNCYDKEIHDFLVEYLKFNEKCNDEKGSKNILLNIIHWGCVEKIELMEFYNAKLKFLNEDIIVLEIKKKLYLLYQKKNNIKLDIMRIVRNIIIEIYSILGWQLFHGACLFYKNKGYVIMGDKYAGKTTSILQVLKDNKEVQFVSNDKILIKEVGDKLQVVSVPISVGIRIKTFANIGIDFEKYLSDYNSYHNVFININKEDNINKKVFLSINEIEQLFGRKVIYKCEIDCMIYMKYDSKLKESQYTKLSYLEILNSQNLQYEKRHLYFKQEKKAHEILFVNYPNIRYCYYERIDADNKIMEIIKGNDEDE